VEGLFVIAVLLFLGMVGFAWYLIIIGAAKVVGGAINLAEDAFSRRNANQNMQTESTIPSSAPKSQFDHFLALGPGPDLARTKDSLYRVIRLQSATKAAYYNHIGYYSAVRNILTNLQTLDSELDDLLNALRRKAQGRADSPGVSQSLALQAGHPNQKPYSSVLWAIEYGHTDNSVVRAVINLVKLQGV